MLWTLGRWAKRKEGQSSQQTDSLFPTPYISQQASPKSSPKSPSWVHNSLQPNSQSVRLVSNAHPPANPSIPSIVPSVNTSRLDPAR
ncbi:hypothetical protein LZ554_005441 [Drepanopeziza brunnea f. sp. 'monogermtubi']|nr:hypothetical protein LZ554_005441 [Drepanopeziza brunnea f. sp. 'monogermtubi']